MRAAARGFFFFCFFFSLFVRRRALKSPHNLPPLQKTAFNSGRRQPVHIHIRAPTVNALNSSARRRGRVGGNSSSSSSWRKPNRRTQAQHQEGPTGCAENTSRPLYLLGAFSHSTTTGGRPGKKTRLRSFHDHLDTRDRPELRPASWGSLCFFPGAEGGEGLRTPPPCPLFSPRRPLITVFRGAAQWGSQRQRSGARNPTKRSSIKRDSHTASVGRRAAH